jgi:ABC-2 type transport system ATP-binding protein
VNAAGPTVVMRNLTKTFIAPNKKKFNAANGVSLEVQPGVLTAFVGPDGAGKSSLMRMMAGLLRPDEGELSVLGIDVRTNPQAVQDRISYMPQRFGLYEDLSVQENLDLYADLHGVPREVRIERFGRMLEMIDMARFTARPAGKLSGGMKQKLGLACTLVRSPDLLLLDEPSAGVDPLSRRDLWKIIEQLIADERLSVIVSTAYMDEAERCSRIFVFNDGCLVDQGAPDDLKAEAEGLTYTTRPVDGAPARALQARLIDAPDRIVDAVPRGGEVCFVRQPSCSEHDLASLLNDEGFTARPADLEDAFMLRLRQLGHTDNEAPSPSRVVPAPTQVERDGEPVIVVRDLVRKFGDFTAVAKTSFQVARGEIFGLLGPNGAGKTTTFRMLCGLLPATSGQLKVAGLDLRTARAEARARIGYVSQKFALYGNLSVKENLQFFAGAYGLRGARAKDRVEAVARQFHLELAATSGILPGGYKQRLAMAASLLHQPEILFLDEPTSGIDPLARRAFWRTITALADDGVTVVVTTHFMEEAEYCDRIAIQDAGRMLALGTPAQVRLQAGRDESIDMNEAFIAIVEAGRAVGREGVAA